MATTTLRITVIIVVLLALVCVQAAILTGQPVLTTLQPATQPAGDLPSNTGSANGGIITVANAGGSASGAAIERGKALFTKFQPAAGAACAACHLANSEKRLVGPGLLNVGLRAESRVPDLSAAGYLRQSILQPGVYLVEGYADIMPKSFAKAFTDAQLDDLIAYLSSLR